MKKRKAKVQYEKDKVYFTQPAKKRFYKPDFTVGKKRFIEVKGRFVAADRQKHLWIKEQHPDIKIYFIFGRSQNTLSRKSKTTYAMWAEEHGFEYIDHTDPIPAHWLSGSDRDGE